MRAFAWFGKLEGYPLEREDSSATLQRMSVPEHDEDIVEVRCPECNVKVRIAREQAERDFKAKCPNGHEVPLVKAL